MAAERLLPPQREAGDLVAAWAGKTAGRATATTPLRWWALVVFVTMSAVQNAVWISFSVLIPEACAFFRVSTASINFLATLGPLVLIPVAFVTGPLSRSLGLRAVVIMGCAMVAVGACLRVPAIYLGGRYGVRFHPFARYGRWLTPRVWTVGGGGSRSERSGRPCDYELSSAAFGDVVPAAGAHHRHGYRLQRADLWGRFRLGGRAGAPPPPAAAAANTCLRRSTS